MERFKEFLGYVLFSVGLIAMLGIGGYIETNYNMKGFVSAVGEVTDERGECWEVDTTEFIVGDKVIIHFDNNFTNTTIYDDIIVGLKRQ